MLQDLDPALASAFAGNAVDVLQEGVRTADFFIFLDGSD